MNDLKVKLIKIEDKKSMFAPGVVTRSCADNDSLQLRNNSDF